MPTTIYNLATNSSTSGYAGTTTRSEVTITGGAQGQVRVTFAAPVAANFNVTHASIGISKLDSTGSTTATPVELLFSGTSGFNLSGGTTIVSDWVNLAGFTVSDKLIVVVDVSGGGSGEISYVPGSDTEYEKATTSSYNVATVAGYSTIAAAIGFNTIEVQASVSGSVLFAQACL